MYTEITSNKRRTAVLMIVFIAVILGLGWLIGEFTGYGYSGLIWAAVISIGMALFSYYSGDKVALMVSGARGPIKKEDSPYVWRMVENLSIAAGQPMPKLYLINDPSINAFATGRDPRHASVAVTQGAIDKLENEELEGVLAHELSHVKNYDIRLMTIVVILVGIIALISDWALRFHVFGGRRSNDRDRGSLHPAIFIVGFVLILLAPLAAQLIKLAVSRRREFLADASGALLTRFPEGLARALEKIAAENRPLARATEATAHLYISNPFGGTRQWLTKYFSTHPPIQERIKKLRGMGR